MQTDIYQQTIVMAKLITDAREMNDVKGAWNFESWIRCGGYNSKEIGVNFRKKKNLEGKRNED